MVTPKRRCGLFEQVKHRHGQDRADERHDDGQLADPTPTPDGERGEPKLFPAPTHAAPVGSATISMMEDKETYKGEVADSVARTAPSSGPA